jgi:very-short-patch-repair endonuclease
MGTPKLTKFEFVWLLLGGPTPLQKEHRFDPDRKWRVDYFCNGVAIEIEGGIWSGGRHNRGAGFLKDMEKYNALAAKGILLFRVPSHQINSKWLQPIIEKIKERT